MPRRCLPYLLLVALLAFPGAAGAQSGKPSTQLSKRASSAKERREASRALDKAQALRDGRGDGHDLTPALAVLATRLRALQGSERKQALALLARPTPGQGVSVNEEEYTVAEAAPYDSAHFRFHYVPSTDDAPNLTDADGSGVPDYIEAMAAEFERVWQVEHMELGWRTPPSDAGYTLRGANGQPVQADGGNGPNDPGRGLTDVYIKQLGDQGIFGYAAPDPFQQRNSQHSFLVLDNDYSPGEYRRYTEPLPPLRVTAAHEYNHVLQFGYDVLQDAWMFESTAVWMEDRVFDEVNDYVNYLTPWSQLSRVPITQFSSFDPRDPGNAKVYGSGVWNRWLDERYGPDVVRAAWESSLSTRPASFAPGAYDRALLLRGVRGGFYEAFTRFLAEAAEWRTANFHEGETWPDMGRLTDEKGVPFSMRSDGLGVQGTLDHTAWAYVDVQPQRGRLKLVMTLPAGDSEQSGPAGALALVGRRGPDVGGAVEVFIKRLPRGGRGAVTIPDASEFTRLTAVLMNSDTDITRFSTVTNDWLWVNDDQRITARVSSDFVAPKVRRRSPGPDKRDVKPDSKVTVTFNEDVEVDAKSFRLVGPGGKRVVGKVRYNRERKRATLDPRGRLKAGKRYRAELSADVVDTGGNSLARSQRRWVFVTAR